MTLFPTRVIFQYPNKGTWFENIAVRTNGAILATRVDAPEVWEIDPATGAGSLLIKLPAPVSAVTGITELSTDVFAIGAGQYDLAKGSVEGSWEIWIFSLGTGAESAQSTLHKVSEVPKAGLVNGITTWDDNTVLAVDSTYGPIYKIDIASGTCTVALNDDLMKPGPEPFVPIGINGIKVRSGYVYFTNTARSSFYRVPIDSSVTATGPVETLASGFPTDDFALDTDGTAYIVTHPQNTVIKVAPDSSEAITIAGKSDSLEIAGGTACAFGRSEKDRRILYVVTSGALAVPVNGEVEPAKLVAVDLS